ncbi:hypothetical protein [uncultured Cohaesibacter sp.]|uniref:hypothetical protein n=1 Tax=uncultured Cohaesibacter sp. TaxID=1002546 RepID=UPI0029C95D25|nr:hypothetical protein [uncultured Cohaesibacter sp.]
MVEAGLNPFLHWIEHGKSEGRAPRDFAELQAEKEYERICAEFEGRFDKDYYLAQNEDVAKSGMDPLRHFILSGWMEGRDPCREFSTRFYLDTYQDVAAAGVNPFLHWLQTGQREGRLGKANGVSERELQEARKVLKGYFDASFYMKYNPDVVGAGVDPLRHYLDIGWKEGRDPSPDFSTLYYLDSYPDIAEAGINPLLHWVTAGQSEGRKGIDEAFRIQFRLAHLKEFPFEKVYQPAKSHKTAVHDDIRQRVEGKKIVLCISHDDYTVIPGGIQFCIRREQKAYNAKDVVYLHLCPTAHGMPLSVSNPKYALSVDGEKLGEISLRTLTASLKSLDLETDLIIHSLLSQKPFRSGGAHGRSQCENGLLLAS